MKAAVIDGPGRVTVTTVPDPSPGPREVLLEIAACGLCGTDLHILEGEFSKTFPIIPGHEFSGEVVGLGRGVETLRIGDQVVVNPSYICYECRYCRKGLQNLCEVAGGYGTSFNGGAAEFVAVGASYCRRLPDHVDTRDAALIEPLSCAVRGYDVLRAGLGSNVLIYGAGTMGLMMLQLAKRAGAASVEIVDVNPLKLEAARQTDCDGAASGAEEFDRPHGWDIVIDATGNEKAIQDGLGRVDRGGIFLQFGVSSEAARAYIEPYAIYRHEITITGSMATLNSFDRAVDLFSSGVLDPALMISDRLPLENYVQAVDRFRAGTGRKIQLVP